MELPRRLTCAPSINNSNDSECPLSSNKTSSQLGHIVLRRSLTSTLDLSNVKKFKAIKDTSRSSSHDRIQLHKSHSHFTIRNAPKTAKTAAPKFALWSVLRERRHPACLVIYGIWPLLSTLLGLTFDSESIGRTRSDRATLTHLASKERRDWRKYQGRFVVSFVERTETTCTLAHRVIYERRLTHMNFESMLFQASTVETRRWHTTWPSYTSSCEECQYQYQRKLQIWCYKLCSVSREQKQPTPGLEWQ